MRRVYKAAGTVIAFAAFAVLLALRIAVASVLAVVTPIVMPILTLLSGGGLLVAIGFACAGHWHDAAKGLSASLICSALFGLVAVLVRIVDPTSFTRPVSISGQQ